MTCFLIDCDPGGDDALAIMMALNIPEIEMLGLTTTGGNARLSDTTRNALRVLETVGRTDLPVFKGAARPQKGYFHYAYDIHGSTGIGVRLRSPVTQVKQPSAQEIISESALENFGTLKIVALGPLTNLAISLNQNPNLIGAIKEIIVMGGAVEVPGNVTDSAEFNFYNDPISANIILNSGIPITLIGLDVTEQVFFKRNQSPWIEGSSCTAILARRIIESWFLRHKTSDNFKLHDPLAILAAIDPTLFSYKRGRVRIETKVPQYRGRTIASYGSGPVQIAVGVDTTLAISKVTTLLQGFTGRTEM